jgi:formylglycine-generating enzyme required for sulfatase activity
MKKIIHLIIVITLLSGVASCATGSRSATGGEVTGVGGSSWAEPTPYGMVLVSRGSVKMGPAKDDSLWNIRANSRGVSVDAFWMDETEITNSKYKQFVFWVRDSIIRERLADPAFGGNEEFKIEEDREGNPVTPHLNWSKPIPWRNANEDEQRAIESLYRTNPVHANSTPNSSTTAMRSTTTPKPPAANTVSTPRAANTTPTAPSPQPLLSSRKTLPGSATKARSSVRPSHAD